MGDPEPPISNEEALKLAKEPEPDTKVSFHKYFHKFLVLKGISDARILSSNKPCIV